MSISPHTRARGLETLIWLKYNIMLKRENIFNLGLNTAKNMYHIQKKLQIKVVWNWILYKKVHERICLSAATPSPSVVEFGARKLDMVEIFIQITFNLKKKKVQN